MHFPVFLDTNVLFPASLVDTLLRLAEVDVIRPHWSADVMSELERNLAPRITPEKAALRCRRMESAFPEAALAPHGLVAVHPDDFLLDHLDLYPQAVRHSLYRQAAATVSPQLTLLELIRQLEKTELRGFAAELRRRWPDLAR